MDTRRPSFGVSPIIATLLLIAITVAAGVIVYVFVSGAIGNLTGGGGGQQTAQQLELTAYASSTSATSCGSLTATTGSCIVISFKNTGSSSATIDSIYINGVALTVVPTIPDTAPSSYCTTIGVDQDCNGLGLANVATTGDGYSGVPSLVGGSSNTLKIVTATGGIFSYTIIAGSSQ